VIGEAGRTNSADGQDIGDFGRGCLQDTQDLAVSNHGRTGRVSCLTDSTRYWNKPPTPTMPV